MVVVSYLKENFRVVKDTKGKKWLVHESHENGELDTAYRIIEHIEGQDYWACPACKAVVPAEVGTAAKSQKVEDPPRMTRDEYDIYAETHERSHVDYEETD